MAAHLKLLDVLTESGLCCLICSAGKADMIVSHSSELGPNSLGRSSLLGVVFPNKTVSLCKKSSAMSFYSQRIPWTGSASFFHPIICNFGT